MQQQIRSVAIAAVAADSLLEISNDGVGIDGGFPVVAHGVPHYGREAEFAGSSQHVRPARAVGGTEVANFFADSVFDGGIRRREFFAHAGRRLIEKPVMGEGVVADEVSCSVHAAGEVAALTDEASDEEEGRADIVADEDFKKPLGARVIGAVIVGQGVFVGVVSGEDSSAEDLRRWPHGGVGVSASGETGRRGDGGAESGEHWN